MVNLKNIINLELLPKVKKPSRYLGTELNSVHKSIDDVKVRIGLAFPDLYDIGLGNLGLHILYAILNGVEDVWAERLYAPGLDMEQLLRDRNLPLFSLESKSPVADLDGIGFTLQSELTYTNILNMLELSKIPLRTKDRSVDAPLTFCGGPAVFNPEPLAPFMDFFVIGDGEDIVLEIADVFRKYKSREGRLVALSQIQGIYVPELYPMDTLENGDIVPALDAPKIRKRLARDLNSATFPVDYIVPFTRQVHDRISLEVLRGCTQGCRFCQAGMTTRPVRERSVDNINQLLKRTLDATGYEEVSLVSLSTCDYSQVRTMVQAVVEQAAPERVGVSLPSLRLDSFSVELADMVADIRRTGLTFAPEAASPRLRSVINKWIPDEELLQMSSEAYKRGWNHVKLYFMIGLPTERDEDVDAIADLTLRTLEVGKGLNSKAKVHTGVSTFVPKPFTPFQWAEQIQPDETIRRQGILDKKIGRNPKIKFGRHNAHETFLEGLVSRSDRRAGDLLERAFELGCRFDAWNEHVRFDLWEQAIEDIGFDVAHALRERDVNERLPWDHIDILIPKKWFQEDWVRATEMSHAKDCRHSTCHKCGVIEEEKGLCSTMLRDSRKGKRKEESFERKPNPFFAGEKPKPGQPPARITEPDPVQRLVFRVGVTGTARFLSHMETNNAWIRTLRRARFKLSYSQGFHPHPKIAYESARPVAEESFATYMDITLSERVDPQEALIRLKAVAVAGFHIFGVKETPIRSPSLMSSVAGMDYVVFTDTDKACLESKIADLLQRDDIIVKRRTKKRKRRGPMFREINLRPHLRSIQVGAPADYSGLDDRTAFQVSLDRVGDRGMRPSELTEALGLKHEDCRVVRINTRFVESSEADHVSKPDTQTVNLHA